MDDDHWYDRSVLEAASWRLASELVRRHPELRIVHTRPGGGQYDCLSITRPGAEVSHIDLNRNGRIHIHRRFDDDRELRLTREWEPVRWDAYLRADPLEFVERMERVAGLVAPSRAPQTVPHTLTYRVLAMMAAIAMKSVRPIVIEPGYLDSSGGCGLNEALDVFQGIADALAQPRADDRIGVAGYWFWVVTQAGRPIVAFEQEQAIVWTPHDGEALDVMGLFDEWSRSVLVTTAEVMRLADIA